MNVGSGNFLDLRGQVLRFDVGANEILDIANAWNVTILGGTFDGGDQPGNDGNWNTAMFRQMIRVRGGGNITIQDCEFRNPIADAIFVTDGASYVTIRNCRFYGNGTNRQAISIIHAWNAWILNNHSVGMARPDQPGHIDLEPDTPEQAVWNVHIEGNVLEGGNARGIQCYNEIANARQFGEVSIQRNIIRGTRDIGIAVQGSPVITEGRVVVAGNDISGAAHKVYVSQWDVQVEQDGKKKHHRKKRRR